MSEPHESPDDPGHPDHEVPTANHPNVDETSGVENMVEEGAPLEPADLAEVSSDAGGALQRELDERTQDLQRLQAEYLNYKRRVERDRELITENATYKALSPVIEVLDTVDRARESGEVEGGFKAVVDQLERAVATAGLTKYAVPGDAFDPQWHEALSHLGADADVEVTTVKVVAKAGYRIGERVVRAAQVLVVDPAEG